MSPYLFIQSRAERLPLPDKSVDLVFGSPPYMDARTYGIGAQRDCIEWVEWMLEVTAEAVRVSKGAVLWVVAGVTRDKCYWPGPEMLLAEWWRRGGQCWRPCYWHRVGIPGSGGKQWFRADVEYVLCFKGPGDLPWSNNVAMGHPPKWAPGGEMSHRLSNGTRRNQWGAKVCGQAERNADGELIKRIRPSHQVSTKAERLVCTIPREGMHTQNTPYCEPKKANPGNLINIPVGGGLLGHPLAHENEAPFPERLAEWFIKSLCPPAGVVLDPFSGSGTTVAVAAREGRIGIGSDLRFSQCELGQRRIRNPHARKTRARIMARPELCLFPSSPSPRPAEQEIKS